MELHYDSHTGLQQKLQQKTYFRVEIVTPNNYLTEKCVLSHFLVVQPNWIWVVPSAHINLKYLFELTYSGGRQIKVVYLLSLSFELYTYFLCFLFQINMPVSNQIYQKKNECTFFVSLKLRILIHLHLLYVYPTSTSFRYNASTFPGDCLMYSPLLIKNRIALRA